MMKTQKPKKIPVDPVGKAAQHKTMTVMLKKPKRQSKPFSGQKKVSPKAY